MKSKVLLLALLAQLFLNPASLQAKSTDLSTMDNVIYAEPLTAEVGTQATLSFRMKNTAVIRNFQFDLYLPEGVTAAKNNKGRYLVSLSSGRLKEDDEHTLTVGVQADGAIRFLCGSQYEEDVFTGNEGEVVTMMVCIAEGMTNGDYPIILKNMRLSEPDISKSHDIDYVETTLKVTGGIEPVKCATPTIIYADGKLKYSCETEGVQFASTITDTDIKSYDTDEVDLSATYIISVYATKTGYGNSDIATGTLCWIEQQPVTGNIVEEDAVTEVRALPVLIQSQGGVIAIQGAADGMTVSVYSIDGKAYGSTIVDNGSATIATSLQPDSVAVVKIGEKAVKVRLK